MSHNVISLTSTIFRYLALFTFVSAETYYITPASNIACSNENVTCLTLTEYAQQSLETAPCSNITLIFEAGNHNLGLNLRVKNATNLIIQVAETNNSSLPVAVVACNHSGFSFESISEVSISGLEFNGCIDNTLTSVEQFLLESCRFHTGHGIELNRVKKATIERSSFVSLRGRIGTVTFTWVAAKFMAGGAIVTRNSTVVINKCQFDENKAEFGGSIYSEDSEVEVHASDFTNNAEELNIDGAVIYCIHSVQRISNERASASVNRTLIGAVTINNSNFINNRAIWRGGVIHAVNVIITVSNSTFTNNSVTVNGGVIVIEKLQDSVVSINHSTFISNKAGYNGGVIDAPSHWQDESDTKKLLDDIIINIHNSTFSSNRADNNGGVISAESSAITINDCTFDNNSAAINGGTIFQYGNLIQGSIAIHNSTFTNNRAEKDGGVITTEGNNRFTIIVNIQNSKFTDNKASGNGGVLQTTKRDTAVFIRKCYSTFISNRAERDGGVIHTLPGQGQPTASSIYILNSIFSNNSANRNGGVLNELGIDIITIQNVSFSNNRAELNGGVIHAYLGKCTIYDSIFTGNSAHNGGALQATNTSIRIQNLIFKNNTAHNHGGVIRVQWWSTIISRGFLQITNNEAMAGIIYAENSTLFFHGNTTISNNHHESLFPLISQRNTMFDGSVKFNYNSITNKRVGLQTLNKKTLETSGIVIRGTVDFTYYQLYNGPKTSELISLKKIYLYVFPDTTIYIPTTSNTAVFTGGTCVYHSVINTKNDLKANTKTNGNIVVDKGVYSFVTSSQLQLNVISSKQTKFNLCFCRNGQPDCSQPPPTIQVKKGQTFTAALAAIDQNGNLIPHTVSASSRNGRLGEGQAIQSTGYTCRELSYTVFSPHDTEQLALNAYGPCDNIEISQAQINVEFLPCFCPVGFKVKTEEVSNCVCICDSKIYPRHITSCSFETKSVQRRGNNWINYINTSDQEGYVIHPHCPFDYCRPSTEQVWIDLNVPNGADELCAFNRSGKLCGTCKDGLSQSLGSSRCLQCSNNWLALLIVFAIAGVAIVAFILVCNLTVAVGTINGLIFYANILTTNRATFFPFETHSFFTVFIAWINLDFGFETCFYDGMDSYAKEWLQLVFPLYIIFMVAIMIIVCEYTTRIARVFTNTNPVATLATLILLSYTKSLRVIIVALSSTTLEYPGSSREMVWLADASIHYFEGKHIPLFLVALIILLVGTVYTLFLFFYQWILPCSYGRLRALNWVRSARFYPFMDAYHAPYNKKHRYWTALLLFVRAFLYVAVTINVSGNPSINLLVIICTLLALCILKMHLPSRVYKSWLLDVLENSFIFNLLVFSVGTFYIRETGGNQAALAYTSTSITFITFLIILLYHTYANILPKKIRYLIDSIKPKVLTDEDQNHDTCDVKQIPENKCTYSMVDPIPPLSKTIAEIEAHNKSWIKNNTRVMKGEKMERNCSSDEISIAHANRQSTEHHGDNKSEKTTAAFNETDSNNEPNSIANNCHTDCQGMNPRASSNTLFVDPNIDNIDQRGFERETEINEIIEITQ